MNITYRLFLKFKVRAAILMKKKYQKFLIIDCWLIQCIVPQFRVFPPTEQNIIFIITFILFSIQRYHKTQTKIHPFWCISIRETHLTIYDSTRRLFRKPLQQITRFVSQTCWFIIDYEQIVCEYNFKYELFHYPYLSELNDSCKGHHIANNKWFRLLLNHMVYYV